MPSNARARNAVTIILVMAAIAAVFIISLIFFEDNFNSVIGKKVKNMGDWQVQMLNSQSVSDDVGAIEKDLNGTNINNLDSELKNIDRAIDNIPN